LKLLNNKTIVITGAGGILCASIAETLASQGAKIALLDLNFTKAQEIENKIISAGGEAKAFKANVLDVDMLKEVEIEISKSLGSCDILINGAGGNHPKGTTSETHLLESHLDNDELITFYDLDPKGIEFVFNLNFLGTLLPTQVFTKNMVGKSDVSVLNISSMNAFTPLTKIPAYSAAKAAVSNFTQWLAVHFAKVGIRVNAIAPGFFLTEQNRRLLTNEDGSLTARGNQIIEQTPMGRYGSPSDLDSTVLWLCNPESSFITGVVVPIDGGFSAYSGV